LLHYLGIALAGLIVSQDPVQDPAAAPIVNPGAPGAATRQISAAQAVDLSRTTYTDEDVRFMQHMIVHHGQAVEMVALLQTRASSPAVRAMGRRIALSQQAEIDLMTNWLVSRGLPVSAADLHAGHDMSAMGQGTAEAHAGHDGQMDHGAHADHAAHTVDPDETPIMPGMLSPAQMRRLAAADGAEFDVLFLTGMIQHHQGALDMVDGLLSYSDSGNDPMLSDFLSSVVADQSAEILRMQSILSEL
jgi:uncharacterized protein (DUF305 family)